MTALINHGLGTMCSVTFSGIPSQSPRLFSLNLLSRPTTNTQTEKNEYDKKAHLFIFDQVSRLASALSEL